MSTRRIESDTDDTPGRAKPHTLTVLGLLAMTSLTFSYLGAYAVSGVLVRADMIHSWPVGADPRPKWLVLGFCVLLAAFVIVGGIARQLSRRQLRQIDEMNDDESAA